MFSFIYSYTEENGYKLRYIPVNEVHKCYFKVCHDRDCPLLPTLHLHPLGMKGCSLETKETTICVRKDCKVSYTHIMHPRCVNKRWNDPLPDFINEHKTDRKPEFVYHFTADGFKTRVHKLKNRHPQYPPIYYDGKPPKGMRYRSKAF